MQYKRYLWVLAAFPSAFAQEQCTSDDDNLNGHEHVQANCRDAAADLVLVLDVPDDGGYYQLPSLPKNQNWDLKRSSGACTVAIKRRDDTMDKEIGAETVKMKTLFSDTLSLISQCVAGWQPLGETGSWGVTTYVKGVGARDIAESPASEDPLLAPRMPKSRIMARIPKFRDVQIGLYGVAQAVMWKLSYLANDMDLYILPWNGQREISTVKDLSYLLYDQFTASTSQMDHTLGQRVGDYYVSAQLVGFNDWADVASLISLDDFNDMMVDCFTKLADDRQAALMFEWVSEYANPSNYESPYGTYVKFIMTRIM